MKTLDHFTIEEDMRIAIEHDSQYLADRGFEQQSAEEQLRINDRLSLFWSSQKPAIAKTESNSLMFKGRAIEMRTFYPAEDQTDSFIIWVHGGGWKEGSLDGYERLMRVLANAAKCAVVGVGYTKAPHATFPAQLGELHAAFGYAAQEIFPSRSNRYVAGYSAGANLALATFSAYQNELGPSFIHKSCLVSGVYDCDFETPSYNRYDDTAFAGSKLRMFDILETYAPGAIGRRDPLVFPVHATQSVCNHFLVVNAEHDLLRDDSVKLIQSLRTQNKHVDAWEVPAVTHIFLQRSMIVASAHQTIVGMGEYLSRS